MEYGKPELIIFDLDGTLADRDTGELLPGVLEWFERDNHREEYLFAIATNQGGVGLRHWMETGGFGDPEKFPTEQDIWRRINKVCEQILPDGLYWAANIYVCFAYQSKKSGQWSPTPDYVEHEQNWRPENRKPEPGMLYRAMHDFGVTGIQTLMVGDAQEDHDAAVNAGCRFITADTFFGRD